MKVFLLRPAMVEHLSFDAGENEVPDWTYPHLVNAGVVRKEEKKRSIERITKSTPKKVVKKK